MRKSVVPHVRPVVGRRVLASVAALAILAGLGHAVAQTAPADPSLLDMATSPRAPQSRMLVEADSLIYDVDDETISAIGKVVIYYGPYTLVADRVSVNRTTKRVNASGAVEITDAAGNVVRGSSIDLTDDLRDGVAEGLEVVTAQRTAFQANRATRTGGDVTTFDDGVYLPCVDCDGVAGRKPIWQIRAREIVHRQGDRSITFRQATFEFAGVPLAWVPVLSQPDPSVRRKSGFLVPTPSYNRQRGFGLAVPYFYALAPDRDLTVAVEGFSRQGALVDLEWRQRLVTGAYRIRAAGLRQASPDEYEGTSGDRRWRGSFATDGLFRINDRWTWGWDLAVATDRSFFDDYDRPEGDDDIVNDVFLTGVDGRNRFDAHLYGFFVTQEDSTEDDALPQELDLQDKQPYVHPVIDHEIYAADPVAGGELSLNTNFTSVSRAKSDFFELDDGSRRLRGAAGAYTRASIDALWRRRFTDGLGQVFTPFAYLRGDAMFSAPSDSAAAGLGDNEFGLRGMPAVGAEYSWPILFASPVGSQVVEPIAQLILRPDEGEIGTFPNEDAQSLVFDPTSLFDYDKFSGYDRLEGGTRLNVGLRYTGQFVNGMAVTGSFGQSIHLAGRNSFSTDTSYETGTESGLDSDRSDYVASLSVNTSMGLLFNGSARLDDQDFSANRVEAQALGISGPLTAALTYAFIREQPALGLEEDRTEVQAAGSLRLNEHWRVFGALRFDIENETIVRNALGLGYDSEAFSMSVAYTEDKTRLTGDLTDRTIYLRFGFRTLGDVSTSVDALQ